MNKLLYILFAAVTLASCSSSFNVQGSTDVQTLDGRMLYLKAIKGEQLKNIDSCDVVHGQFAFRGIIDTVKVGALFIENDFVMPVVLEDGEIFIQFNTAKQTCTGTPLNDTLAVFIEKFNQTHNQIEELQHQQNRAILNGDDLDTVNEQLQIKFEQLNAQNEKMVTAFIEENFDNILGPYVFQMVTGDMQVPLTNAWIEALMVKATPKFKANEYVKSFMEAAERNQAIMTGMEDPAPAPQQDVNAQNAPVQAPVPAAEPPSPNELAAPAK